MNGLQEGKSYYIEYRQQLRPYDKPRLARATAEKYGDYWYIFDTRRYIRLEAGRVVGELA